MLVKTKVSNSYIICIPKKSKYLNLDNLLKLIYFNLLKLNLMNIFYKYYINIYLICI